MQYPVHCRLWHEEPEHMSGVCFDTPTNSGLARAKPALPVRETSVIPASHGFHNRDVTVPSCDQSCLAWAQGGGVVCGSSPDR